VKVVSCRVTMGTLQRVDSNFDAMFATAAALLSSPILWAAVLLYLCAYLYQYWLCRSWPKVLHSQSQRTSEVVAGMDILREPYRYPLVWGFDGFYQSFYSAVFRQSFTQPKYRRERLETADGGIIVLDWLDNKVTSNSAPIMILLPGVCSTSQSNYIRWFATLCQRQGWRAVVYHPRGVAELKTPKLFTIGGTSDIRQAVTHIQECFPKSAILATAFSLGGYLLVKYVGEEGLAGRTPLLGALSVSHSFCAEASSVHIDRNPYYDKMLSSKLKALVLRHEELFKHAVDIEQVKNSINSCRDFDNLVTCKTHGFESPEAYYHHHNSRPHIPHVAIPLMSVWAKDDPLLSEDMFPLEELLQNDNIILVSTDKGGHLGWNEGLLLPSRTHWFERLAMEYFRLLLKTQKHSN